jgi:hypothetical protein
MSKMEILAHRGWWTSREDQNSLDALTRALTAGFGVETDIRDCAGRLVVSHDMPTAPLLSLDALLDRHANIPQAGTLALNVKADGLASALISAIQERKISNYFVFDMSVPDTLHYLKAEAPVFTRRSEFETGSALDQQADGLWLDAFHAPFAPLADIHYAKDLGKSIALVSPELHRKDHLQAWSVWREAMASRHNDVSHWMVCTDFPERADGFFNNASGNAS